MSFEERITSLCERFPAAPKQAIMASRLVFRVATQLDRHIDAALAPYELDRRQYLLLAILATSGIGASITPSELGTTLDATRTQMTRLLDSLEARHLVRRLHSLADRRSLSIELTDDGQSLLQQAAPVVHAAYREIWSILGEAGTQTIVDNLHELDQALIKGSE